MALGLILFGIVYSTPPKDLKPDATAEEQKKYDEALVKFDTAGGTFQFGKFGGFIDPASMAITIGGTFAALMVAFPVAAFTSVPKHLKIALFPTKYDAGAYIEQIVGFAKEARMKGLLSLEDKLQGVSDMFLKSSLMLVVDSVEPEKVHNLLQSELEHLDDRHASVCSFYDKGAAFAPGFGMIGTLIGLVNMLADMSDPASIGPAMATALLTTLYGSMLGNLFFGPISNKLRVRHEEEYLCKVLICEGVEAIQAGENPRFIEEKLQMLVIQTKKKGKKGKKSAKDDEAEE
ncbi:MAG: MotA/TolQ/ExbB proton channel family protein [Oscillospiraceae bacterium]|nr:MotA/TolQ/ExbB proton channel family protein [Oscillospiraceae bacterium]